MRESNLVRLKQISYKLIGSHSRRQDPISSVQLSYRYHSEFHPHANQIRTSNLMLIMLTKSLVDKRYTIQFFFKLKERSRSDREILLTN